MFTAINPKPYPGAILVLLTIVLAFQAAASAASQRPTVAVSILPQRWFVEKIAGDLCEVLILVGPGHSPATYEPTVRQMASVQSAIIYFSAGVPFENGILPKLEAMSQGPPVHGYRPDIAADGHAHGHGDMDPHTWLDVAQAQAIADTICLNLTAVMPESAAVFAARRQDLQRELDELDQEIRTILAPCAGSTFFVFHPAFGHFAHRYGLHQAAVEVAGHEPGARQMVKIIEEARRQGAQAIIVQPQFSRQPAEAVARAIGAQVVTLDPLGADYPQTMKSIAVGLAKVLDCTEGESK